MSETTYQLTFDGETLRYTPADRLGWQVHKSEIVLIGESTYGGLELGNVPSMCVIDRGGASYFAPLDASGFAYATAALSLALKADLKFAGVRSRGCKSRAIWPHGLRDKAMFEFESVKANGWFARLFRSRVVEQHLTDEMLEALLAIARSEVRSRHPTVDRPVVAPRTSRAATGSRVSMR